MASNPKGSGYWHELADRARTEAAQLTDGESKMILLQIADAYKRMALRAETLADRANRSSQKAT
jgi:hypothetical protein